MSLLRDLDDHEWIYWCIDDKFLLKINVCKAMDCFEWVSQKYSSDIQGAMFCRCRRLLEECHLITYDIRTSPGGEKYIRRKNYHQFWIHQFLRVGLLRKLFLSFPDRSFRAKEMDYLTGQQPGMNVLPFDYNEKVYVSGMNHAIFGESMHGGKLTRLCRDSMARHSIEIPSGYVMTDSQTIIGDL